MFCTAQDGTAAVRKLRRRRPSPTIPAEPPKDCRLRTKAGEPRFLVAIPGRNAEKESSTHLAQATPVAKRYCILTHTLVNALPASRSPLVRFVIAFAVLTLIGSPWLFELVGFASQSKLYSHTLLIPFVALALAWPMRTEMPAKPVPAWRAVAPLACGAAACLAYAWLASPLGEPHHRLTWMIAAWVLAVIAAGYLAFGSGYMNINAGASGVLLFMIPMPIWMENGIEALLQRGSADCAQFFFSLGGVPFLRDSQVFRLPSITLEIAQECSGIHSSLVLLIVSFVAAHMFLQPGWRRWVLVLAVLPLALLRNGFRVFVLGVLCEHYGPQMIDHWIHHRGGPVFFALSLIPFFTLMIVLTRTDRARKRGGPQDRVNSAASRDAQPPLIERS